MSCVFYRFKGVHNKIRLIMDLKCFYYLAVEYMDCNYCSKTYTAYNDSGANTAW